MSDAQRPLRLVIIEDHLVMSTALRLLLSSRADIQVVGEAASGTEAIALLRTEQPDMALLDLFLTDGASLALLPQLQAASPGTRLLVLTATPDVALHRAVMAAGARGVVLKEEPAEVLLKAIERVRDGEIWLDAKLLAQVFSAPPSGALSAAQQRIASLTAREREIIQSLAKGLKNKQIAEQLYLSERTVQNHLASIFAKLEVSDRLELVLFAQENALIK